MPSTNNHKNERRDFATIAMTLTLMTTIAWAKHTARTNGERIIPAIQWETGIKKFQFDAEKFVGQRLTVKCPPLPANQSFSGLSGTDSYPSDSSICVAALHAGVITRDGGTVTLQLNPGLSAYEGSNRNGVQSADRPATRRSFTFVTESTLAKNEKLRAKFLPRIEWGTKFTATGFAHRHLLGQQFAFRCPPMPTNLRSRIVYGTDTYAFSSIICRAALHAGMLPAKGGIVTVQLNPGVPKLVGSIRNGVETKSKRGSDRSLSFVNVGEPKKTTAQSTERKIR